MYRALVITGYHSIVFSEDAVATPRSCEMFSNGRRSTPGAAG